MLIIKMIFINMMLIAKLSKKLEQVGILQVQDMVMAVQSLKKSCTFLVEMDMELEKITLFTP